MHLNNNKNYVYKLQDPQKAQINNKTPKRGWFIQLTILGTEGSQNGSSENNFLIQLWGKAPVSK